MRARRAHAAANHTAPATRGERATTIGASKVIYVPTVAFIEEDFNATDAYAPFPDRRTTTFLPGPTNRTVTATLQGQHTDDYCAARISFQITYVLRQYPNL